MDEIFDQPDMFYRLVEKAMPFRTVEDRGKGCSRLMVTVDGVERKVYMRSRFYGYPEENKALSMKNRPPAMKTVYRIEFTFVMESFFRILGDYEVVDGSGRDIIVNAAKWKYSILSTYERSKEELEHLIVLLALQ